METESLNWLRFANCLIDVGTEVLHKLLMFKIETCCFGEYHQLWLEKVTLYSKSNDSKVLWNTIDQQCRALDASSHQILQSLLPKWKQSCGQTPTKIPKQLQFLKRLEETVRDCMINHATQQDTLKKWSSEIQNLYTTNTSLLMLLKTWTQEFFNLCQVDQLDLVRLTERHHERTNTFLTVFLSKLEFCKKQGPGELNTVVKTFEQEESNFAQELQTELDSFFISWQSKIDKLLDLWITLISSGPHQQILHSLVIDVKTGLPRVHQMCKTGLQKQNICSTWRTKFRNMLSDWSNKLQQVGASTIDTQDLAKTWHDDLQAFPLASDQQIRDFFGSKGDMLQKLRQHFTNPQWSLLYPTQGYIDLRKFDIALLYTLHIYVFPICPPDFDWNGDILEAYHAPGEDLMSLKSLRNDYIGHIPAPTLTNNESEKLWTILGASLRRLSQALDIEFSDKVNQKITQLKTCPFDFSEDIKHKLEFINWNQADTYKKVTELLTQKAFKAQINLMKEKIELVKKSVTRFEQDMTKPSDSLSRTEILEGMKSISETMTTIETRTTHVETLISNQKMNITKLEKGIDLMRGKIERHNSDNSEVHVRTRAFDHARDILHDHKHLVLQGKPGEGKTYLALSLVADLIKTETEIAPVEIHNANEWDEMVDTKLPLVVLMDDVLGKYGVSETVLDRWKKISEIIHPRLSGSSIFLIVCIRTQIASLIKVSLWRNEALFLFNSHVVDISVEPHCLTKEERAQMLIKYVPEFVDKNDTLTIKDISEMDNVIGFAHNCKIFSNGKNVSVDLKEMFANNPFLVEEMQNMSKQSPETYTFLVLLMLSGGYLPLESKMNELKNTMKTRSEYCGLRTLSSGELKNIGHSLCGTFLECNKKTKKFKFQHDCIETAVFVSFRNKYPDIALEHCSLKQLSKMCCVSNELERFDGDHFLNFNILIGDDHFRLMRKRFSEGLESGETDSFKSIAEALVWKNQRFADQFAETMTFADNVLNFLTKRDSNGHSLLIHLINAKSTLVVRSIIKNISQCSLRDDTVVGRQFILAATNACLTGQKQILKDLLEFRDKVDDFVMLAAASAGSVSTMEMLVRRGGNINATISIKNRKDLANVIKNCISHPKTSPYHHGVNLFHIACSYGLTDMVKYLMNSYPELVHRTSSVGGTALHFLAYSENVELMKVLSAEQESNNDPTLSLPKPVGIDISTRDNDDVNVLHIAAEADNIKIVKYLIKNNPSMLLQKNRFGGTAMHYAASGGSVPVMETLIQAGLDINARSNSGSHVLHSAAKSDNLPIVKYLIRNKPQFILQTNNNGYTALHAAAHGCSIPVLQTLIQAGLDINARTHDCLHVLHIAARNDNLPIVKYLIETNPSMVLQDDKNGWTALHFAAEGGNVPVMETLIQAGLEIHARTNDGLHVLHIASIEHNLPIVKYLIENNPKVTLQKNNGWTAIHYAAKGGSIPVMENLIQAGLDINAITDDGLHVLGIAAMADNLPIVQYLIQNNPRVTLQTHNGWTAMHYAAHGGSVPVMETLIQAGLHINKTTNYGVNILHIATRNNNLPIVKYLIETSPQLIQQKDKNGWAAIHYAAERCSVPVMESLIQAGLDINAKTNNGTNVLHIAATKDNLPIVKYLIENNPPLILQNSENGWSAMHYAAMGGSVPMIEKLIQAGLDINTKTNCCSHVLHIAAMKDNVPLVKYLIKKKLPMIAQKDKNEWTSVHYAAEGGSVPVIESLIQAGLDVNEKTKDGFHVLHIAAINNNLPVVKYLIANNPRVILQKRNGWTAMHYAAKGGSAPMIETLMQTGLDINARTNDGVHILHIAAGNDNLPIIKYLIQKYPPMLLQKYKTGWTVLHYAAKGGSIPVMETLIQKGLDINARTNDGVHILHIASWYDNLPIVKYLIKNYPTMLLHKNKNGWTSLHYAAKGGSVSVMETLIEAELDTNARTNCGFHMLHIAACNNNLPIVKYLIKNTPSLIQQTDTHGCTAMHAAAEGCSVHLMKTLIQAGLDINARTNDGTHLLHIAAKADNLPIVKYLIEHNRPMILQSDTNGWTAIHHAAQRGSIHLIETLIQAGLDINAKTNNGSQVLHIAAGNDNLRIVKHLIENNRPVIPQNDTNRWTAKQYVAQPGSVPVIEELMQAGLDINARPNDGSQVMNVAAMKDNLPISKYFIEKELTMVILNDKNGWTPMHFAAKRGSVPLMETLIQAGLDINAMTNDGSHVLHIGARSDNLPIVKYLIKNNPLLIPQKNRSGWTAIHYAAEGCSVLVMETLIQAGLDINALTNDGTHVLHIAAMIDNLPRVKYLIENKPPVILQKDKNGWTAMHCAAQGGSVPVMESLIHAGLDINTMTSDGNHVLHIAAMKDNLPIIKYLIKNNQPMILHNYKNGWSAVHYAAQGGSVAVMETLIQTGLDISARTNDDFHVLHIAAMKDNKPIVKYLIENNPTVIRQYNKNGWTAMHCAAQGGSVPVMEMLIQAGLDIQARTINGDHVLHIAASNNNLPILKYLIENNPQVTQQKDKKGWTAMHHAALGGSIPLIETLIQAGLDINARTNDGCHILHIAAMNDNMSIVKYLIENIPPMTIQNNTTGWTPIHFSAKRSSIIMMKTLVQAGFDINARTHDGLHALHIAAGNDNLLIVKYLIEINPEMILQENNNGWTAIHCAAQGGSVYVLEMLLQAGLDISTKTSNGGHVLHVAASNNNLPIVKHLIENNPLLKYQEDKNGWTAMHYAAKGGSVFVMETLIQAGLDINARTNNGSQVLHIAGRNDNLPIVKYLVEDNLPMILQKNKIGWTPVHSAAKGGGVTVMEMLIQSGFDINERTNDGYHVLHIAAENDNLPIVKYLIENNPPMMLQKCKNGWTAIHFAGKGGSIPIMETLVQAGLDINARTNDGLHVLDIAAVNDKLPIVKYLIESEIAMILKRVTSGSTPINAGANETLIQPRLDISARTNDDYHILHLSSRNENLSIVKYLAENNQLKVRHENKTGWTAVHFAAKGGSVPVMETLIQAGLDINARMSDGCHALHIAAANDNLPIVKYLIKYNPPVILYKNNNGWTAMHYAAQGGSVPVMETLIQAGLYIKDRTNDGFHLLHIAAMKDNVPIVKYLIKNNLPEILQKDKNGWTAMHYAAQGGSVLLMETLLQAGLDINARTNDACHVLHIAAMKDNLPIVKYLIENNPISVLEKDKAGWTAMHYAAKGGRIPVMETLIQAGLESNAMMNDGCHVLHIAAMYDNLPIVKYLIENNPPVILQKDRNGWTAMHHAAQGCSVPMMENLIRAGLDINARTNDDFHVLHIAAQNNNLPIVKYLIESNQLVMLQNNLWTAMHATAQGGSVPVMEILTQAGLDINARTSDGRTVMHIAAMKDNLPIVKYLLEVNPPSVLQNDKSGWTAMHFAALGSSVTVMETLLQAGLNINARTDDGFNVLHIAARNDNLSIVKYLIENHSQMILENDSNGWTAMHSAAEGGSVPVMETLKHAGLDINARTIDGFDVLHIAATNDNLPIVKYLVEKNSAMII